MNPEQENIPSHLTMERIAQTAREVLLRDGIHIPTLLVEGSKQTVIVQIAEVEATYEGRQAQLFAIGADIARHRAIGMLEQIFFIAEGWVSVGDPPPHNRPALDPQRKEVLMISGLALREGKIGLMLLEMVRDEGEELRELKAFPEPEPNHTQVESPLLTAFVAGFARGIM